MRNILSVCHNCRVFLNSTEFSYVVTKYLCTDLKEKYYVGVVVPHELRSHQRLSAVNIFYLRRVVLIFYEETSLNDQYKNYLCQKIVSAPCSGNPTVVSCLFLDSNTCKQSGKNHSGRNVSVWDKNKGVWLGCGGAYSFSCGTFPFLSPVLWLCITVLATCPCSFNWWRFVIHQCFNQSISYCWFNFSRSPCCWLLTWT